MNNSFSGCQPINTIHDEALVETFREAIGLRVLILTPSFPFMFIGEILSVVEDYVEIAVEITQFAQLENRSWFVHIDNIEVFYIERPGKPQIPELDDMK